jgi:hypothetical protein
MQVYFFFFVVLPMMRGRARRRPQQPWEGAEGLEVGSALAGARSTPSSSAQAQRRGAKILA